MPGQVLVNCVCDDCRACPRRSVVSRISSISLQATASPTFMLLSRKDPSTEPVHSLDDPAAMGADEVLAQKLLCRNLF